MIQKATHATPRMDLGEAFHEYTMDGVRLIAGDIAPEFGVAKKEATLSVCRRENMTIPNVNRANGGTYNRVNLYMDDMSYGAVNRGLEGQVTDEDRENFTNDFDAEAEETYNIKIKMRLARELRIRQLVFNTTTFTGAALYTDYSAAPWDAAGSGVISQIQTVREKVRINCGIPPNSLIISESSMINLMNNTEIKAKFPGAPVITEQMLRAQMAAILGIQNLLVGQAVYNSADEGQDFSGSEIWPDDYALVAVLGTANMPIQQPQLARTIRWDAYASDIEYVESYREEQTESDIIRVKSFTDEKLIDAYFGHLMLIDA